MGLADLWVKNGYLFWCWSWVSRELENNLSWDWWSWVRWGKITSGGIWSTGSWVSVIVWDGIWFSSSAWSSDMSIEWSVGSSACFDFAVNTWSTIGSVA